jgi:DHA1 family multidrug resistance protein-like MFS transporter/DHA1 family quinolone resistance protein-like MFS transporter
MTETSRVLLLLNQPRARFYLTIFISSLGLGAYTYFIPVFAQTFGATFLDLGFIGSATAVTYAVTPMLAGYLADRFNRVWLFRGALVFNALATISLVFSNSVQDVLVLRLAAGFGLGFFWPISEVLVADLATVDKRVAEMGWYSVAWGSGYLIGPSIGGFVAQRFGYIQLFAISAILIAIALVTNLLTVLPEGRHDPEVLDGSSKISSTIRNLLPWYMMLLCYAMVFGVIVAIFPGYANTVGVSPELIGLLFTLFGITRVLVFAMSGRYSRFSEKKALGLTSGVLALGSLIIAAFPSFAGFSAALMMMGGAIGVIFPTTISLISRHFPNYRTGAAIGSYEATFGVGFALGPLLAGTVAALTGIFTTFLMTASFGVMMLFFTYTGHTYVQISNQDHPEIDDQQNQTRTKGEDWLSERR